MLTDEELTERIKQALLLDGRLSSQPIEVSTTDGFVCLKGIVQSHQRKRAAMDIAASFQGTRGVVAELTVEPPRSISDERVAEHVRAALDAHADITPETILVSVSDGVVTLKGNVFSDWERVVAEDVAISSRGVRGIYNLLTVNRTENIKDRALDRDIEAALSYTRGLREANIRVAVSGDTVVLAGEVSELWQKEMAETVVRRFPVSEISNEIVVTGS